MKSSVTVIRQTATVLLALCLLAMALPFAADAQQSGSEVLIDRADKQNITGNTEIGFVWGQQLEPPQSLLRGVINLMEAMNTWTKVETSLDRHLQLSDKRIMNIPFIFVTADKQFELTQTEINNLREYIDNGGFIFADNAQPAGENSMSGAALKQMLKDVIPNARFEALQNSSEIYHSFFDFNDGPPLGAELGASISNGETFISPQRLYLEGVRYKGRLVAVYSDKGYIVKWADELGSDPQLRMGINLIVYALTQDGSIAKQTLR